MADIPIRKPNNIKPGDKITANWLNKSKNSIANLSASAPLQVQQNAGNFNISHAPHGPAVRWGSVCSDYVWSDATTVKVYPMEYSVGSDFEKSKITSTAAKNIVNVYVTNPVSNVVSDISDITKGLILKTSDIISYMWFGDKYGTMLGEAPRRQGIYFGTPTSSDFTSDSIITLSPCDRNGESLGESDIDIYLTLNRDVVSLDFTSSDIISYSLFTEPVKDVIGVAVGVGEPLHDLLNGDSHRDTEEISPASGKLIRGITAGSDSKWSGTSAPSDSSIFVNSTGEYSWATPPQTGISTLKSSDGTISWGASDIPTLLNSDSHADTETKTPLHSSVIVGSATLIDSDVKWTKVDVQPAAGVQVLTYREDTFNAQWKYPYLLDSHTHNDVLGGEVRRHDLIVANANSQWTNLRAPSEASLLVHDDVLTRWITPPQTGTYFLKTEDGYFEWIESDTTSDLPHNLLDGNRHPDTVAETPAQGSLVVGNDSEKWEKLVAPQTGNYRLQNSDGVVSWGDPDLPVGSDRSVLYWHPGSDKWVATGPVPSADSGYTLCTDGESVPYWAKPKLLSPAVHSDTYTTTPSTGKFIIGGLDGYGNKVWKGLNPPNDDSILVNSSDGASWEAPDDTGSYVLGSSDGTISWGAFHHNLLDSNIHDDTTSESCEWGALIVGSVVNSWTKLSPPTSDSVLTHDTFNAEWTAGVSGTVKVLDSTSPAQYDSNSHTLKLNLKTLTITKGIITEISSAVEETAMTFTAKTVMDNYGISGTTFTKDTIDVYVPEFDNNSNGQTVHTGTECAE